MQTGGLLSKLLWPPTTMEISWVAAGEPVKVFVTDGLVSVQSVRHKAAFVSYTIIDPQFDSFRCLSYGAKHYMGESRVHVLGVFWKRQS